ncbi:MAG: tRNA threonylcarbamoyladenosine dehydratase [Ruminococcaceae bacterium]|nr:tRNA threonylcarbamoyladenosine dehydratase [Oscillospiraceae bacterium]
MINEFSRAELILGSEAMEKLKNSHVAVFGVGGVGGYVCEALARGGVYKLSLFDNDTVSLTNINRQIIALHSTIGRKKVEVAKERLLDINPEAEINIFDTFVTEQNIDEIDFAKFDYVVDAIDTVTGKVGIIKKAYDLNIPVISSMGAGNKLDPTAFKVTDINKTSVCPLARVMRKKLKDIGVEKCKVLYSEEIPLTPRVSEETKDGRRVTPGSLSFVPSAAGLIIAGEVIKDIIK